MSSLIKELPLKKDIKIALIEQTLRNADDALKRIERKLDQFDTKFDSLHKKLDDQYNGLNLRIWTNFLWLVGFGIALYGSLFAVLSHALKWF